jgi:hypothetical protein
MADQRVRWRSPATRSRIYKSFGNRCVYRMPVIAAAQGLRIGCIADQPRTTSFVDTRAFPSTDLVKLPTSGLRDNVVENLFGGITSGVPVIQVYALGPGV